MSNRIIKLLSTYYKTRGLFVKMGKEWAISRVSIVVGYNSLGQFRDGFVHRELPVLQEPEYHLLITPPVSARREAWMLPLQPFFNLQDELHT